MNVCVIPTTVSSNNTFQPACCQRAPPATVLSIIHEGPNNAASWFTTSTLKVTCFLSLTHTQKHTQRCRLILIVLILPQIPAARITEEAVSGSKWLHYQGHLLESNLARLGPQTGPANLLNGHQFISRCLGAVACEVRSFGAKQDGCDI